LPDIGIDRKGAGDSRDAARHIQDDDGVGLLWSPGYFFSIVKKLYIASLRQYP
jgi:hypothetical protein